MPHPAALEGCQSFESAAQFHPRVYLESAEKMNESGSLKVSERLVAVMLPLLGEFAKVGQGQGKAEEARLKLTVRGIKIVFSYFLTL